MRTTCFSILLTAWLSILSGVTTAQTPQAAVPAYEAQTQTAYGAPYYSYSPQYRHCPPPQDSAQVGVVPSATSLGAPGTLYTARREMPSDAASDSAAASLPAEMRTATPSEPGKESKWSTYFKKMLPPKDSAYAPPTSDTSTASKSSSASTKSEAEIESKNKSFFTAMFTPAKGSDQVDDGQDQIDRLDRQRHFTERDYYESATRPKKTTAKDLYARGMQEEAAGQFDAAIRSYNAFIKANKKQTREGALAAPYHRLALIAWKQAQTKNADVYFRYAMRYAQGGNIPVIAGDYSLFLIERGELDQAEVVLRNTMLYYPEDKRLQVSLGRCLTRRNKPIEAIRYLTESLGEEQAYAEVALIYHEMGEDALARSMQRKRDEYWARIHNRNLSAPGLHAARPIAPSQGSRPGTPLTPPPVLPDARGLNARQTLVYPVPYPAPGGNVNPQLGALPPSSGPYFVPPEVNPTPPEPAPEPAATPTWPVVDTSMPVSRVFHYPAGDNMPTYHQYIGEHYPRTPRDANHPAESSYPMGAAVPPPPQAPVGR